MSNWDEYDQRYEEQDSYDANGNRQIKRNPIPPSTDNTIDIWKQHGITGLIFVSVFGLHDPSSSVTGAIARKYLPKLVGLAKSRPLLARVLGSIVVFCVMMTFVPARLNDFWKWSRERLYASVTISKDDTIFYNNVMEFIISKAVSETVEHFMLDPGARSRITIGWTPPATSQPFLFTSEDDGNTIKLWCFGRSPKPIKELLAEIQKTSAEKQKNSVSVFGVQQGRWVEQNSAKRRPIESVFMETDVKEAIMNDLKLFLSEGAEMWYNARGANYRKGYLFFGLPGCGKTLLIKAIAAYFNLSIYTLSLTDKSINDDVLKTLFGRLKKGDLLVLEDIDCADIDYDSLEEEVAKFRAQQDAKRGKKNKRAAKKQAKQTKLEQLAAKSAPKLRAEPPKKEEPKSEPLTNVTLAGLLNTMDGISSSTGYVLIMTTNKPQALDRAVTRAGRVGKIIEFGYISRNTAREMFTFYFQPIDKMQCGYDLTAIPELAKRFAEQLPENGLSPAQVQDYLLQYPSNPAQAVKNVAKWIHEEKERANVLGGSTSGSGKHKERI
ncbi:hypothetical protein OHC33_005815 [Knufia fluminis]|uniref:Mitochondrial chaperone BCS1 n=1 Tax=Knufia fluminis TaxID=191047 RepID=A0AAN8EL14_9EURO|nr:hypothetical protein OHC33_005815 [Knufia fluminis]